ncbi:MAG: hypothetical protein ACUVRZ_10610 [Desulfobacca sp.]|uniref:hypothetical protein n=1 Tax=Desulfobacca sp. TaxID=2067990 RepID=UPI00404AD1BE
MAQRAANQQAISNGRADILAEQQKRFEPLDDLQGIPVLTAVTDQPLETVLAAVLAFLPPDTPRLE